jgi:hypothetical protein
MFAHPMFLNTFVNKPVALLVCCGIDGGAEYLFFNTRVYLQFRAHFFHDFLPGLAAPVAGGVKLAEEFLDPLMIVLQHCSGRRSLSEVSLCARHAVVYVTACKLCASPNIEV